MNANQKISACILGTILVLAGSVAAQDVVIIANKSLPLSQMSSAEMREIFLGTRSRFGDGSRAVPVVLKGGPVHEVFLHKHIGDTPDEFRVRWRKLVFTGQGSMIRELTSESALIEYISATPGAIGYVSRLADGAPVKVISVLQ